jgi:hypothetical protein
MDEVFGFDKVRILTSKALGRFEDGGEIERLMPRYGLDQWDVSSKVALDVYRVDNGLYTLINAIHNLQRV